MCNFRACQESNGGIRAFILSVVKTPCSTLKDMCHMANNKYANISQLLKKQGETSQRRERKKII